MLLYRHHPFRKQAHQPAFWFIYVLSVVFTFHALLIAYSSSSYMERFTSPEVVGMLYTVASALAVISFLFISRVLQKTGNVWLTIGLAVIEVTALILMGLTLSNEITILAFLVFLFINPLLYLNIDIFSEGLIGSDESGTGSKRGLTLSLMSLASVIAPLTLSFIVGSDESRLYLTYYVSAAIFLIFIGIIIWQFRDFKDPKYQAVDALSAIRSFWVSRDLRYVFLAHFVLQIFFAFMVIYFPLYLSTEVNMSWENIGYIIAFGLFAYVLVEFPAGILADKYLGEKEMMAVGFVILAVSASWVSFMAAAPVLSWMFLMFISRIGASLVEVTTESYFFKHTEGSDANIIGFFRLTRPLSVIVGSLVGSLALLFLPFELMFVILGFLMVPGAFFASRLKDTK